MIGGRVGDHENHTYSGDVSSTVAIARVRKDTEDGGTVSTLVSDGPPLKIERELHACATMARVR